LEGVDFVGPVVAVYFAGYFANPVNLGLVASLRDSGVSWPAAEIDNSDGPLNGTVWVVTGKLLSMSRDEAESRLRGLGAKTAASVSSKTTTVVAGPGAGSKKKKAEALDIPVVDEEALIRILGGPF
jgi:DNA ligase (NAD+)